MTWHRTPWRLLAAPLLAVVLTACLLAAPKPDRGKWSFPLISGAGGIRSLPDAAEPPSASSAVVFDITQLADPGKPAKGIDRMARLLNLYADHQVPVSAQTGGQVPRFALVLHGDATAAVLNDAAYQQATGKDKNASLPLLRRFRQLGVEVYVCGQALAHKGYAHDDVDSDVQVAVSAMNVLINKQNGGYAYLPFH